MQVDTRCGQGKLADCRDAVKVLDNSFQLHRNNRYSIYFSKNCIIIYIIRCIVFPLWNWNFIIIKMTRGSAEEHFAKNILIEIDSKM